MAQEVAVDFPQYLTSKVATLRDKQIGILGIKRLATALTTTDHAVECLNLAGNEIDDEGADILVKALKKCPSITALDLSSNNITDTGAPYLASYMKTSTSLKHLNLSSNCIGELGAATFADVLFTNTVLEYFNLYDNFLQDAGTSAIAYALGANEKLVTLGLSMNNITDTAVTDLAQALQSNTQLQRLYIHNNHITDTGIEQLYSTLANRKLLSFNISRNKISEGVIKKLQKNPPATIFDCSFQFGHTYVEIYQDRLAQFGPKLVTNVPKKSRKPDSPVIATSTRHNRGSKAFTLVGGAKYPAFLKKDLPSAQAIQSALQETESLILELKSQVEANTTCLTKIRAQIAARQKDLGMDIEGANLVKTLENLKGEETKLVEANNKLNNETFAREREGDELASVLRCTYLVVGWLQDEATKNSLTKPGAPPRSTELTTEIVSQVAQFYA